MDLPVIAAAIDLTIDIRGEISEGHDIRLDLEDLNEQVEFDSRNARYTAERDYLRSSVNVLRRRHLFQPRNIQASIRGNIPIQAGTSSSSALVVAWCGFLLRAAGPEDGIQVPPSQIAELAYQAEVVEFGESGGRMDQYASAIGGIVYLDFYRDLEVAPLPAHQVIKEFVLGDSLQPKDTQKTLKRIRHGQEQGLKELSRHISFKHPYHLEWEEVRACLPKISIEWRSYLEAVLSNHDITRQARMELSKASPDIPRIAALMNRHHFILRERLGISTPRIERMIEHAMAAGAMSAKINGSGEGGCMFAFCPGKQAEVAEAIARAGGKPYVINVGPGLQIETS